MSFNGYRRGGLFPHTTHQGGKGYPASPEVELLLLVAGSLFSGDTFYEAEGERHARFAGLAQDMVRRDPHFVGSLAVFARQVLGLRSGPSALVAHLFWEGPRELAQRVATQVWLRGDEHLETLAYTRGQGWKVRKALKKAVAERLNRMSPQALLKYRAEGRHFRQRDALILAHPKAPDREHAWVYDYLIRGKKASPEALAFVQRVREEDPLWERVISKEGSTPEAWRKVLPHLEGLALIRNLRNLQEHGLLDRREVQDLLLAKLADPERVRGWRIFPHQWLQALYQLCPGDGVAQGGMRPHPVYHALEGALEASVPRLDLEGETLILVDVSGSMYQRMSRKGESTYALAAATLGAVLYRQAGGRLFGFSDDLIPVPFSPGDPLVAMVEHLLTSGGYGTYLERALGKALRSFGGRRVVILTDEQVADDAYRPLRPWLLGDDRRRVHVINLAGYAPLAFPQNGISRIGGFSDRLLELLPLLEAQDPIGWMKAFGREHGLEVG